MCIYIVGILQPPFYGIKHPDYYSYGSLAMFIAHELSVNVQRYGLLYEYIVTLRNNSMHLIVKVVNLMVLVDLKM
jgi:hypothetical protein